MEGVHMKIIMNEKKISIKYVRKARLWCKTTFADQKNAKGKVVQKEEWSINRPE